MKKRSTQNGLTVKAVAGTHCVFLGFDLAQRSAKNLIGFAIQREDLTEKETVWLRSSKTFASQGALAGNEDQSSLVAPFQAFQWADYAAKPGHSYKYRIYPMSGKPGKLVQGAGVSVAVQTETAEASGAEKHSVYFNRGAVASQAYVKRFGLVKPEQAGQSALDWLARDLLAGLLAFINRAKGKGDALRIAIYEAHFAPVLEALAAAVTRGVDVQMIYSAKVGDSMTALNERAMAACNLGGIAIARTQAKIAHNKFIVLLKKGKPQAVWSGSMNWSDNAVYGQLNVGHAVNDAALATRYLAYWTALQSDPALGALQGWVEGNNPLPGASQLAGEGGVFSPHKGGAYYQLCQATTAQARKCLFMTFPFGMSQAFRTCYDHNDAVLRYALLDKYANGGTTASQAAAKADTQRIRALPNVGMAVGSRITVDTIDGWMKEVMPLGKHVNWVHTKFMLIDPLGTSPTVVTGSANWSEPSTNQNDENMLFIKGDQRVAHIYFTEFMRLFAHHRFRESVQRHVEQTGTAATWKPNNLKETPAEWVTPHYQVGTEYELRRRYFSG